MTEIKKTSTPFYIENKHHGFIIYKSLSRRDFNTFNWIKSKIDNFKVENITIEKLIIKNHIDIVIWLINQEYVKCNKYIVNAVCRNGGATILQILHERGLLKKYDEYALLYACEKKQIEVLNWWLNSGLELKYDTKLIKWLIIDNNIDILNWLSKSGLIMKFDKLTHDYIDKKSTPEIKQWWLENKNRGQYVEY